MNRIRTGALALTIFLFSAVGTAEIVVRGTEQGFVCDPPEVSDVIRDRFVRVPADPSQPDVNELPTSPLSVGTIALAPDIPGSERAWMGDPAYTACRPGGDGENEASPPPRTRPVPGK